MNGSMLVLRVAVGVILMVLSGLVVTGDPAQIGQWFSVLTWNQSHDVIWSVLILLAAAALIGGQWYPRLDGVFVVISAVPLGAIATKWLMVFVLMFRDIPYAVQPPIVAMLVVICFGIALHAAVLRSPWTVALVWCILVGASAQNALQVAAYFKQQVDFPLAAP